jgi:hypothetical protein
MKEGAVETGWEGRKEIGFGKRRSEGSSVLGRRRLERRAERRKMRESRRAERKRVKRQVGEKVVGKKRLGEWMFGRRKEVGEKVEVVGGKGWREKA